MEMVRWCDKAQGSDFAPQIKVKAKRSVEYQKPNFKNTKRFLLGLFIIHWV